MSRKKQGWASAFTSLFVEIEEESGGSGGEVDIEALLRETNELTAGLEGDDVGAASGNGDAPPSRPAPPPAPEPTEAPPGLEIGQPLKELYAAYRVPATPKSIEEIMLFLEGLKAMPHNVQVTALRAMDDADPNWSIADVVLDARYKVEALRKAKGAVDAQVQAARDEAHTQIRQQDTYLSEARGTIRGQIEALHAQIAELQALQAAEEAQVEQARSAARERVSSLEAQAAREHQRIETEIERITRVVDAIGPMAEEP